MGNFLRKTIVEILFKLKDANPFFVSFFIDINSAPVSTLSFNNNLY